ncbi:hypothetical protein Mal15_48050 [Stieleria maiorica]|uniref:Uncharacterized protein n=1 Tax=Stieleria maiorica TaxID=2795974 RepID=A0A5B9MHH5_9BACT|nr:hypothetical protein Mal15_48050 [Stieleria maiorica]
MAANHGMQRSGGGAVSHEINVNSRRPLIPVVRRLAAVTLSETFFCQRSITKASVFSFAFWIYWLRHLPL